jgi:hypothetical protein
MLRTGFLPATASSSEAYRWFSINYSPGKKNRQMIHSDIGNFQYPQAKKIPFHAELRIPSFM